MCMNSPYIIQVSEKIPTAVLVHSWDNIEGRGYLQASRYSYGLEWLHEKSN